MSFSLTSNFLLNARGLTFADGGGVAWTFNSNTNVVAADASGAAPLSANPTAHVGLSAVNGAAATFMRSDAAPPIDQTIVPTWSGLHTFTGGATFSGTFTLSAHTLALTGNASLSGTNTGDQAIPAAANPAGAVGLAAVDGSAVTFMRSDAAPALSVGISPTWTGNHVFTPASGNAGIFNGVANSYAVGIVGNATSGESYGGYVQAGTTSADISWLVENHAGTPYFQVRGDGAIGGYGPTAAALVSMVPDTASFTGTYTGVSTVSPTSTCVWARIGNLVVLFLAGTGALTSNANTFTLTGLPAAIQPARSQFVAIPDDCVQNNSTLLGSTVSALLSAASGTLTFFIGGSSTGWTSTGSKFVSGSFTIAYLLN